jgi:hypothetical protein
VSPTDSDSHGGNGKPAVPIIVNTRSFEWETKEITYEQVYDLAYPGQPLADGDVARIEYSRGPDGDGSGSLVPGTSVHVKQKMVFDVYVTVRS